MVLIICQKLNITTNVKHIRNLTDVNNLRTFKLVKYITTRIEYTLTGHFTIEHFKIQIIGQRAAYHKALKSKIALHTSVNKVIIIN